MESIRGSVNVVLPSPTITMKASLRSNLALHHLRAAAEAARRAHTVQQANLSANHGPWFDEMLTSVPVSVMSAAAAFEANANEIISDILEKSNPLKIKPSALQLLRDLKKDRTGNSLEKYRNLALICGQVPKNGTVEWEHADLLIKFRNSLMHFKPAWDHEIDVHDGKLVKRLRKIIPTYGAYETVFIFPYGLMTYGGAKWSVETVVNFSREFCQFLRVNDRFGKSGPDFLLP